MNAWVWRPATDADVVHVGQHMWERGRLELAAYGRDVYGWGLTCFDLIDAGMCFSFIRGGVPQAILGLRCDNGTARTMLQATEEAELTGLSRFMRKANQAIASGYGVRVSDLRSLCVSKNALKWYEFLGFVEDNAHAGHEYGGYKERRFVRIWNQSHV